MRTHRRYSGSCFSLGMQAEPETPSRVSALPRRSTPCRSHRRAKEGRRGAHAEPGRKGQQQRGDDAHHHAHGDLPAVGGVHAAAAAAALGLRRHHRAARRRRRLVRLRTRASTSATCWRIAPCFWSSGDVACASVLHLVITPTQSSHERRGQPPLTFCAAWPLAVLLSQLRRPARDRCCDALRCCPSGRIRATALAGRALARAAAPVAIAAIAQPQRFCWA